jgi:hypothetical protein
VFRRSSQASLILTSTGAATDETSFATDSATAIVASAANVTLLVLYLVIILPIMKIKGIVGDLIELFKLMDRLRIKTKQGD